MCSQRVPVENKNPIREALNPSAMSGASGLIKTTVVLSKAKPKLQSKANQAKKATAAKAPLKIRNVPKSLNIAKPVGVKELDSPSPPKCGSKSPSSKVSKPKDGLVARSARRRLSVPPKEEIGTKSKPHQGARKKLSLVRTNSTPNVVPKSVSPIIKQIQNQSLQSRSSENLIKAKSPLLEDHGPINKLAKTVRIDESVQIRLFQDRSPQGSKKSILQRSLSFQSTHDEDPDSARKRRFKGFFPRRRFSQSAIEPIRELLSEIELQEVKKKAAIAPEVPLGTCHLVADISDESFRNLPREQQLEILSARSNLSEDDAARDWIGLRSLTGVNASGWKYQDSFYGNFNVGRRPSMDTAWGRRVYDQYEIECPDNKPKNKYLGDEDLHKEPKELGLWDLIFNPEIIPKLEGVQHWDPLHEDKLKEMKKLKIDPSRLQEEVVISDEDDPLSQFKLKFMQTGEYLRPHDMKYCIEKTNFAEEQIIDWFKRFKRDCPDGKLTRDNLRSLFRQAFPDGNAERFTKHVMRIFDSDGNDFLDFKEFLMAMDIATCDTEESKLAWAFKLFDCDNSGCIEVSEMIAIMETLDSLDGNRIKKQLILDEYGNPEPISSATDRANDLFEALDKDGDGVLTMEEFVNGYMERNELMARQDAQEQKRKLNCLILKGPCIPEDEGIQHDKAILTITGLLSKRAGVACEDDDIDFVSLRPPTEETPKSAFVRFKERDIRTCVWNNRSFARKNGLHLEEYLTVVRQKLLLRCKELKEQKLIKDVFTKNGDIFTVLGEKSPDPPHDHQKMMVITDKHFEALVKATKGGGSTH